MPEQLQHPYPPGTKVFHAAQEWARSLPGGTAVVIEAGRPYGQAQFRYLVRTGRDFSRRPGVGNPLTREAWWDSARTLPAVGGAS